MKIEETAPSEPDSSDASDITWSVGTRHQLIWIDGVRISPFDCPGCLDSRPIPCEECSFFAPGLCKLRQDPLLLEDCASLFDYYRGREIVRQRYESMAVLAIHEELKAHGRPLHYTVLSRIMSDRHADLRLSEAMVLRLLTERHRQFDELGEGVFRYK